jgi:PAS domain S-box-containing protein
MRFEASHSLSEEYREAMTGHTPWRRGTRDARPIVIPDVLSDEELIPYRNIFVRENIRAQVFIPLEGERGVFGKFMLYYAEPHVCSENELAVAQLIAGHVSLAIERRRAETSLAQSERRLQTILDNSPAVVFAKDMEGRYTLINQRFEDLFGLTKGDVLGKTDADLFSPQLAETVRENDLRVLELGQPLTIEEEIPQADGSHTYLSVKFPVDDPHGAISGVCGIATDITDRKKLENASLHVAAIVENSEDAIVSKDLNGIVTSWNPGAARIFGYTAAEMVGKPIATLATPDVINEMPVILEKIRKGEPVEHYETRRRTKTGQIIDVSLTISPVRDASGRIIGASKIARDITERKQIERERALLLSREQEARKTAELLNRVGPLLGTELSLGKLVQSVTDVATELVGAEFGSFFHNVVNEQGESYMLYTLSGVSREAFAQFPMPRNTAVFGPTFRGEGIVRCHDVMQDPRYGKNAPHYGMPKGHLPVRSYLAAPVISRSGEVLGGLFFGHSVPGKFTERHESILAGIAPQAAVAMDNARLFEQTTRVQKELARSNEELRRANQDLETFAYSASHDLQEPLRTVIISAQLLGRRYKQNLPSDASDLLGTVISGAKRMESLIRDVLTYATATKYEEGAPPAVDAKEVLASVVDDLDHLIRETGAAVTSENLPVVCAHENRLAQLFQNLIGNALKYRSTQAPRVHISAVERENWWVFSVADNGIGIDSAFAGHIFRLFKRLHRQDEYPGSGIGLAVCQRIVEQYGGRIWLEESTPGKGSTFCFTLPVGAR